MKKIAIYTLENCSYCDEAKRVLNENNVQYEEICVDNFSHIREVLYHITGIGTLPQIFIDTKCIGGCDDLKKLSSEEIKLLF